MKADMAVPTKRNEFLFLIISTLSIILGIGVGMGAFWVIGVVFALEGLLLALWIGLHRLWPWALWIALFGLVIWSYGFNNIPLIRPLPLVDALVAFALVVSLSRWWPLRKISPVKKLLFTLTALSLVVGFRLILDWPRFGLLAVRDALFAFELWTIFPAIALGYRLGEEKAKRYIGILFVVSLLWYVFYPWRYQITANGPTVGVQRPVPLFAFTTAGFWSVVAFFWFLLQNRKGWNNTFGILVSLWVMFVAQSRGAYLAWIGSLLALTFAGPRRFFKRGWRLALGLMLGLGLLALVGGTVKGRLGVPVGVETMVAQLETLLGREGPGLGSFEHRLRDWPKLVRQVVESPFGPFIGVGLGTDLFQGFTIKGGVLVRKPHNDFLEIWARLGIIGLVPWLVFLIILGWEAFKGTRRNLRHGWVLALQIMLWVTSMGQPAMGFAYITVTWTGLTGLWLGSQLRGRQRELRSLSPQSHGNTLKGR